MTRRTRRGVHVGVDVFAMRDNRLAFVPNASGSVPTRMPRAVPRVDVDAASLTESLSSFVYGCEILATFRKKGFRNLF